MKSRIKKVFEKLLSLSNILRNDKQRPNSYDLQNRFQ